MPGIFLTTNVFAHVGGLFFSLSFTRKKACKESELSRRLTLALIGGRINRPLWGLCPHTPDRGYEKLAIACTSIRFFRVSLVRLLRADAYFLSRERK